MNNNQISDLVFYSQVTIEESMGAAKHQASFVEAFGNNIPTMHVGAITSNMGASKPASFQRTRSAKSNSGRFKTGIKTISRSK